MASAGWVMPAKAGQTSDQRNAECRSERADNTILVCTVGGSHQPILTTLRELAPAQTLFLVTDRDPATGQPGSRVQVDGNGLVIMAHPGDYKPSLPNLPTLAGLAAGSFQTRIVPADDLDDAFRIAEDTLRQALANPACRVVADYTGGTKTMSAALVLAALEHPAVALRLVTGMRANLHRVTAESETGVPASIECLRLRRQMSAPLSAWRAHGYAESAMALRSIATPRNAVARANLQIARDLSAAFDAWDRFDHAAASALLMPYRPRLGQQIGALFRFLEALNADAADPRREPAQLIDLWLNALRRAAQGRYDDAVARLYRLLEWTAQWLLRQHADIDTANLDPARIPPDLLPAPARNGVHQAGLSLAWALIERLLDGPPQAFAQAQLPAMRDRLQLRNQSILAHGFVPVDAQGWDSMHEWAQEQLLPLLSNELDQLRFRLDPADLQLPVQPFWQSDNGIDYER